MITPAIAKVQANSRPIPYPIRMAIQILQTKLYIPTLQPDTQRVFRPRLIGRLEAGLDRKLTLLSAPAGSGKTTLLSEWIESRSGSRDDGVKSRAIRENASPPTASFSWLSLDQHDNDPSRFWTHLVAALQIVQPDLGTDSLAMLQAPQMPPIQAVLTPLLNDIAARSTKIPLVLDDYHTILAPAIHEGLSYLIEHQPPQLHLVVSTRADPPLPIARLRARRQMTELRDRDLRFTGAEAATYLNETMDLNLESSDIAALAGRTEGWIVGLQLAALSMQGRADKSVFIEAFTGSHHYILEYLTEEVVHRQPKSVQRFLVHTSTLDRLCGSLCNALTGDNDGDAVLADLHRQNLFVVPLDDEHCWYRYHHLFADLLSNLARKELSADNLRMLHRRASRWHTQNGDPDGAIGHALQATDYEQAADLIEQTAQAAIAHGRLTTLLTWIQALPGELQDDRPRLCLYYGWALNLSGQIETAEQVLHDLRSTLQGQPASAENEALRGQLAALLTGIATLRQEADAVIREAEDALAHLPEQDRVSRARVYMALGTAYAYEDSTEKAIQTWQRARDLALAADNPFLATAAVEMLAGTQIYHQGQLRAAEQALRQVIERGTTPDGRQLPFTGTAHALLADIHLEWNELETAASDLETSIDLQRQGGIGYGLIHTYCAKARLSRALDDREGAVQALQRAEQALQANSLWHMILHLAACQVRLRLWIGDVRAALCWAEADPAVTGREPSDNLPSYLREIQRISLARVQLDRGESKKTLETLSGLVEQATTAGRTLQAIEASLLQALALQAQNQPDAALVYLDQCLSWAEPEGYLRIFLETGPSLSSLLQLALARDLHSTYSRTLLEAMGQAPADLSPAAPSPPQTWTEPLTPRERQILQLIRAGLSNREIAEKLVVTLNTVKKHSSNIYNKLGVRSRTQALARAQELGLL